MTIVAVNGGGNTPNGEAAGARSEGAYVLTGVEHRAREDSGEADTFSFDQSVSENSASRSGGNFVMPRTVARSGSPRKTPKPEAANCLSGI
jgi:hypothetical protein